MPNPKIKGTNTRYLILSLAIYISTPGIFCVDIGKLHISQVVIDKIMSVENIIPLIPEIHILSCFFLFGTMRVSSSLEATVSSRAFQSGIRILGEMSP